jgi:hypothetical protein
MSHASSMSSSAVSAPARQEEITGEIIELSTGSLSAAASVKRKRSRAAALNRQQDAEKLKVRHSRRSKARAGIQNPLIYPQFTGIYLTSLDRCTIRMR